MFYPYKNDYKQIDKDKYSLILENVLISEVAVWRREILSNVSLDTLRPVLT